jgi:hypothetical protein
VSIALSSKRTHFLKNTISVLACNKKMHGNEKIFSAPTGLPDGLACAARAPSTLANLPERFSKRATLDSSAFILVFFEDSSA